MTAKVHRVYRVEFHDPVRGLLYFWRRSESDANRTLRGLQAKRESPVGVESVTPMDIPSSKSGLLGWLNLNFDMDNG